MTLLQLSSTSLSSCREASLRALFSAFASAIPSRLELMVLSRAVFCAYKAECILEHPFSSQSP